MAIFDSEYENDNGEDQEEDNEEDEDTCDNFELAGKSTIRNIISREVFLHQLIDKL